MPQIQFIDFVVLDAELEYIIMRQSTEYGSFWFCLFLWVARALRTWKMVHYSPDPCIWQPFSVSGCCLWNTEHWILREMTSSMAPMLGLTVDTGLVTVLGFLKNFTYFLRRRWGSNFGVLSPAEWRSMLSRCFDLSPCTHSSPLEHRHCFLRAHLSTFACCWTIHMENNCLKAWRRRQQSKRSDWGDSLHSENAMGVFEGIVAGRRGPKICRKDDRTTAWGCGEGGNRSFPVRSFNASWMRVYCACLASNHRIGPEMRLCCPSTALVLLI